MSYERPSSPPVGGGSSGSLPGGPRRATWGARGAAALPALGAALLAGLASWFAGETTHRTFRPSEGASSQSYRFTELNRQVALSSARNGAIVYGTLGALLGLALGTAGGLTRGSRSAAVTGGGVGLILGAVAGALPSFAVMPWLWAHRHDDPTSVTLVPILLHCGLWVALGGAGGVAYALGRSGSRAPALVRGAFGGLAGALAGTVAFELIAALAFPMDRTDEPFAPTAVTRLLPHLCVALFTAAGAVMSVVPREAPGTAGRSEHA